MKQPTEQEIKEFWEWCGFEWRDMKVLKRVLSSKGAVPIYSQSGWYLNGELYNYRDYPSIDLNNLFQYAVPKLERLSDLVFYKYPTGWSVTLKFQGSDRWENGEGEDPALALFWAIKQVMEKEK